jgi:hypothetical protein
MIDLIFLVFRLFFFFSHIHTNKIFVEIKSVFVILFSKKKNRHFNMFLDNYGQET